MVSQVWCLIRPGLVLYVCDAGNAVIRRIQISSGTTSLVVGAPGAPGAAADGATGTVSSGLAGLAFAGLSKPDTVLLLSDAENHLLRAVDLADGPIITNMLPNAAGNVAAVTITLTGTNLPLSPLASLVRSAASVGSTTPVDFSCSSWTRISTTQATCVVPMGLSIALSPFVVIVQTGATAFSPPSLSTYTILPPATITDVSPALGAEMTPLTITITGSNFGFDAGSVSSVLFGPTGTEQAASSVSFVSSSVLLVRLPPTLSASAGAIRFTVNVKGSSAATSSSTQTFLPLSQTVTAAGLITSVCPSGGVNPFTPALVTLTLAFSHPITVALRSKRDVSAVYHSSSSTGAGSYLCRGPRLVDATHLTCTSASVFPAGAVVFFAVEFSGLLSAWTGSDNTMTIMPPMVASVSPSLAAYGAPVQIWLNGTGFGCSQGDVINIYTRVLQTGAISNCSTVTWISPRQLSCRIDGVGFAAASTVSFNVTVRSSLAPFPQIAGLWSNGSAAVLNTIDGIGVDRTVGGLFSADSVVYSPLTSSPDCAFGVHVCAAGGWVSGSGTYPHTLRVRFPGGAAWMIMYFTMTATSSSPSTAPSNFLVQASNDGFTWTTVLAQNSVTWFAGETKFFSLNCLTAYSHFQVLVVSSPLGSLVGDVSIGRVVFTTPSSAVPTLLPLLPNRAANGRGRARASTPVSRAVYLPIGAFGGPGWRPDLLSPTLPIWLEYTMPNNQSVVLRQYEIGSAQLLQGMAATPMNWSEKLVHNRFCSEVSPLSRDSLWFVFACVKQCSCGLAVARIFGLWC